MTEIAYAVFSCEFNPTGIQRWDNVTETKTRIANIGYDEFPIKLTDGRLCIVGALWQDEQLDKIDQLTEQEFSALLPKLDSIKP